MRAYCLSVAGFLLSGALAAGSQGQYRIEQAPPVECWPIDEFLLVRSAFVPPENVRSVKVYFRSTAFPDYYFVEVTLGPDALAALAAGEGRATVPKAQPETREVTFYVELLTDTFEAFRTEERTVPVTSGTECRRRDPAAAYFPDNDPNIVVHATRPGAAALPPGFQSEGIGSVVNAAGAASETGGGLSGKTIGIVAGAGGAAAAIVVAQGGGSSSSTSVVAATSISSTTVSTTTTSATPSSSTTTSSPTTSNPTTSVSTTTSVGAMADMSVTKTGSASGAVGQNLNYSITVDNLGPANASNVRVQDTWTSGLATFFAANPPLCTSIAANRVRCDLGSMSSSANPITIRLTLRAALGGQLTNTATVTLGSSATDPNSGNNSDSATTRIALTDGPASERDMTYRSSIAVEPRSGQVRGQIVVNGRSYQATDNSGDFLYAARVSDGPNRIETRLDVPAGASGMWRFDFGGSQDFVSGSLRVESGQVLSQDGASVVFKVGREAPSPRFTFEVGEGRRTPPR